MHSNKYPTYVVSMALSPLASTRFQLQLIDPKAFMQDPSPRFTFLTICRLETGNVKLGIDDSRKHEGDYVWSYVDSSIIASGYVYGENEQEYREDTSEEWFVRDTN